MTRGTCPSRLNRVTTANKANGKRSPLGQALSGARFKSLHK
ncbi:hypothetical protein HanXRQr2_Chr17g0781231 [Helianthus annuus]|uniref:Uncharacterized protein n=1 Tax=Helianthus annuus TaxID=4232 RepID=A0A9K3GSW1_HELAN|nr:hypothetical protein HanXRQr2_Chr17g0781231 [Helianthus annuus]